MLVRALIFRKAFVSMELYDNSYKTLPSEDEWNRGEMMADLLKPFSVITTHFSGFLELERSIDDGVGSTKSHLDVYLDEPRLERKMFRDLDVLGYWKENEHRFGDLASLVCDVLSIPITIVASESAFSIGGRVLTPYRNRFLPEKICEPALFSAFLCRRSLHTISIFSKTLFVSRRYSLRDVTSSVNFHFDGALLTASDLSGQIIIYDLTERMPLRKLCSHTAQARFEEDEGGDSGNKSLALSFLVTYSSVHLQQQHYELRRKNKMRVTRNQV